MQDAHSLIRAKRQAKFVIRVHEVKSTVIPGLDTTGVPCSEISACITLRACGTPTVKGF